MRGGVIWSQGSTPPRGVCIKYWMLRLLRSDVTTLWPPRCWRPCWSVTQTSAKIEIYLELSTGWSSVGPGGFMSAHSCDRLLIALLSLSERSRCNWCERRNACFCSMQIWCTRAVHNSVYIISHEPVKRNSCCILQACRNLKEIPIKAWNPTNICVYKKITKAVP